MGKQKNKGPSLDDLESSFRQRKFSPLYLFCGEEEFLVDQSIQLLIEHAVDESMKSFNLDIIYGGSVDAKDIVSLVSQFPMMSERRVVIVKEIDRVSNKEILLPIIEKPNSSSVAVFISSKPDFRLKFFKSFQEHGTVVEFKQLYDNEIPAWIAARVKILGKNINPEAAQLMQAYVGRSLREVQNEIDKLFIYVGDKKSIDVDDVNNVVGMSKQYNVFELQKAVGQKHLSQAMEIAERMIDAGESPLGMVIMLTRYFQKVWLLKEIQGKGSSEYQIAAALGVSPFFLKDYLIASRSFMDKDIEACFSALLETDERLKLSGDPKLSMTLLIHRIIRGSNTTIELEKQQI